MIGDWVCYRIGKDKQSMPMQVCLISESEVYLTFEDNEADPWICDNSDIVPVSLTTEILEKNGFHYTNNHTLKGADTYVSQLNQQGFDYTITIKLNDYFALDSFDDRRYRLAEISTGKWYVHELQHALKLCGIDKTIEL